MKRTTVNLPDEVAILLDLERRRRDVSAATIIREALDVYFRKQQDAATPRRALRIAALGHGSGNIAANMEAILATEARTPEARDAMLYGAETPRDQATAAPYAEADAGRHAEEPAAD